MRESGKKDSFCVCACVKVKLHLPFATIRTSKRFLARMNAQMFLHCNRNDDDDEIKLNNSISMLLLTMMFEFESLIAIGTFEFP